MKFTYIVFFAIILSTFSCREKRFNQPEVNLSSDTTTADSIPILNRYQDEWTFDSLSLEKKIYIDNDTTKAGMNINLFLKYPATAPNNVDINQIQILFAQIFSYRQDKNLSPQEAFAYRTKEYESQALGYGEEWQEENNQYIDFSNFDLSIATSGEITSQYVITVSTTQGSYLGGAHGSYYIKYDIIDLLNGKIIKEKDFFQAEYKEKVAKLIQNQIVKRNDSEDESEHIYLLVDLDTVEPNENFYFSTEGMVYTYNQYEITPYAQGPIEIIIPYEEIKPLIKDSQLFLLQDLIN